jgi:ComF family protein
MPIGVSVAAAWLHVLAPGRCPGCDGDLSATAVGFCAACAPLIEPAAPLPRAAEPAAAFAYGGPMADAILRLKYAGRTEIAKVLGALLAEAARVHAGQIDRVVPLPLHARKLRERGFNQSALLARPVARALGVTLDTASLRRVRPTEEQAGLTRQRRVENVRGAFSARRSVAGERVLLIDDVRTTGATLEAAADALRAAGCREVRTLALACAGD